MPPTDDPGDGTVVVTQGDGNAIQMLKIFDFHLSNKCLVKCSIFDSNLVLNKCISHFISEVNILNLGLAITVGVLVIVILVGIAVFVGCKCLTFSKRGVRLNKEKLIYLLPQPVLKIKQVGCNGTYL